MNAKNLKNLTIIPPDLYIRRDADRQVRQIVNDMGRPGYVLVARQMGKTNLLLNIRRDFQSLEDAFVYIDVSNIFPTLRTFFRNIIDTAVSGTAYLGGAQEEIALRRERTKAFPEHQEHESELAYLLSLLRGKLVICLDEVDALSKTLFSDNVFSFIRSVYFSGRINVSSFSRLTYLLSGVAEPTELIKNKAISPFNIGAKIYLEDFSRIELGELADKLAAPVTNEVVDRVYFWTHGHPRLSWDLLSLLEDRAIASLPIASADVDAIVQDSYLTHFDLPPIDHIRTLVQDDREIRDAIMSIHYGRSESISTNLRTRLYLNGIISSQQSDGQVVLKNSLLEAALSEDWLRSVDQEKRTAYERAEAAYAKNDYASAVNLYKEFLATATSKSSEMFVLSKLGISLMRIGRFSEALESLRADPVTEEDSLLGFVQNRFFSGVCYRYLGMQEEARTEFEEVVRCGDKPRLRAYYLQARINLASMDIADLPAKRDAVVESCDIVLRGLREEEADVLDTDSDSSLSVAAQFLKHQVFAFEGNVDAAERSLRLAIEDALGDDRVTMTIRLARYLADNGSQLSSVELEHAVDLVESLTPVLREKSAFDQLALTEERLGSLLKMAVTFDVPLDLTSRLFKYLSSKVVTPGQSQRIVLSTVYGSIKALAEERLTELLVLAAGSFRSAESIALQRSILLLLGLSRPEVFDYDLCDQMAGAFKPESFSLEEDQAGFFLLAVRAILLSGNVEGAARIVESLVTHALDGNASRETNEEIEAWVIARDHLLFLLSEQRSNIGDALELANKNLAALRRFEGARGREHLGDDEIRLMTASLNRFLRNVPKEPVRRSQPKIGRNDMVSVRLASGEVQSGKYKRFEQLVVNGSATIISD